MSKKAQATLKDVIPIFIEELEKAGGQRSKLDSRIQMLLEHRLDVNTESIEKLIEGHKNSLNNASNYISQSHDDFANNLKQENNNLENIFAQNQKKLVEINSSKKDKLTNFYLYTAIAFIVAILSIYYGLNKQLKLNEMAAEYNTENEINIELFNFIKEKELIDEYGEWYNQMQEK